jgi:hypothetical protein
MRRCDRRRGRFCPAADSKRTQRQTAIAGAASAAAMRRHNMFRYGLPLMIAAALLGVAPAARSCECDLEESEIEYAARYTDVVFIGMVYDIRHDADTGVTVITFRVMKSWKNPLPYLINLTTSSNRIDCGYDRFYPYATFLVYASGYYDRGLTTSICNRTHPLYADDADLAYLRRNLKEY